MGVLSSYPALIRLIADGDPVEASVANRAPEALARRTESLRNLLLSIGAGQLLALSGQRVPAGAPLGTPVYLDNASGEFVPAQVSSLLDVLQGTPANQSFVCGVISSLSSQTEATIALYGKVTVAEAAWAVVGVVEAGHYYLSNGTAGELVQDPGPYGVYVGQYLGGGEFLLRPEIPQRGSHQHYKFELLGSPAVAAPTGVNTPAPGNPHVITLPDASERGWLPVTSFSTATYEIPPGAAFGYNIAHPDETDLLAVWPPQPLDGATFVQGGIVLDEASVVVNSSGIWWMTSAYGTAPWPVDFAATGAAETVRLWFSLPMVATFAATVQSISAHPDCVVSLRVLSPTGDDATSGDIRILIDSVFGSYAYDSEGAVALKEIVDGEARFGPVVSRLVPGPGIRLTSPHGNNAAGLYGPVTISVTNSADLHGDPANVVLNNARQDILNYASVVVLPAGRTSNPVFRFQLSPVSPTTGSIKLTAWVYSSITGTTPASFMGTYRVLPPSQQNLGSLGFSGALTGAALLSVQAGRYEPIELGTIMAPAAGSIVDVMLTRTVSDGFAGDLGILRLSYSFVL